ncbi:MAG TPA: substrate-binding domain-containing protein [Phycisphaerae bacterium]|nr:substrate-binding domain-containing protein [Phycisphaerae bacterium]
MRVALAGAQIPVELVESWLHESRATVFSTSQVAPVYMSQHGFENLAHGECDLACTDRLITPRELEQFGDQRISGRRVAFYGYALYVNPSNPLDAIFSRHVRLVFQRRITDWSSLAGEEIPHLQGPINLYGPAKSTRAGMVLGPIANIWFADATWQVLDSDAAIVAKVAADPLGLGFAMIGYEDGVRYLGLRMERNATPAFPSLEEIESERYGLAKLIYVYYVDPPSPAVQAVLDFLASAAGREAIEGTDLWAVPPERATLPPTP